MDRHPPVRDFRNKCTIMRCTTPESNNADEMDRVHKLTEEMADISKDAFLQIIAELQGGVRVHG